MRLTCPYCGERAIDEFVHAGDAAPIRPDPTGPAATAAFYVYGYERANVAGIHAELWYHAAGCHAWLVVHRDTRTHEVAAVAFARDVALARNTQPAEAAR